MVAILARYASRFSVRALDLTVDSSLLWVGAALAVVAAVILAFVPRLPSADTSSGLSLSSGSVRMTGSTSRRQRIFAVTQIAASFVLLAGASMLITTLIALQTTQTGVDTRHVLAINVPVMSYGKTPQQVLDFYKESIRRVDALPGVNKTAFGHESFPGAMPSPVSACSSPLTVTSMLAGEEDPRAQWRVISPGFFAALGVPIIAGRDFNDLDGQTEDDEPVVIVSRDSRTAHVPQSGCHQSACLLDGSRAAIRSRGSAPRAAPHHRRHRRYRRRARRSRAHPHHL